MLRTQERDMLDSAILFIIAGLLGSILIVLRDIDKRLAFMIRRTRWPDHDWPGREDEVSRSETASRELH
jgi:hypothetical protein